MATATDSRVEAPAYVYGITWATSASSYADGVGGEGVEPVVHGAVAALVSALPDATVRARRRDLVRHARVIQDAFESDTVVPLRFGTVFQSGADVVADVLEPHHDELVALLRRLAGLAELTVRAFYDQDAVLAEIVREDRSVAALRESAIASSDPALHLQLGEAVADRLEARRETDAGLVLSAVVPLTHDVVVEERQADLEVLRAALLVDRTNIAAVDAAMDEVARSREGVIRFKYAGPLPPHHFVGGQWAS